MKNKTEWLTRKLALPAALLTLGSLAPMTFTAEGAVNPTISLSATSLNYGYSGPVTISVTGTGTHFNSSSVVYILDQSESSVGGASGFQVSSPTSMTFSLAAGLGTSAHDTAYEVEVETVESGSTVETTQLKTLTVKGITASASPSSLSDAYANGTSVQLSVSGMALDSQTSVNLKDSNSSDVTAFIGQPSVTANAVSVPLNAGLPSGPYTFVITDGNKSVSVPFTVAASSASSSTTATITSLTLPAAVPGQSYDGFLRANPASETWSVTNLPSWLHLDPTTGELTGTVPQEFQDLQLQVTATPTAGAAGHAQVTLPLATSSLQISTTTLPDAVIGQPYAMQLQANVSNVTWSVSGLPAGLTLNPLTGAVSGTVAGVAGNYTVQVSVRDNLGNTATVNLLLIVASAGGSGGVPGLPGSGGGGSGSTGPSSYGTVVASESVGAAGAQVTKTVSGSDVELDVPQGAFQTAQTVTLTTADVTTLSSVVPSGSKAVAAIGVGFAGVNPGVPVTLTVKNANIPANGQVFKIVGGHLVPAKATVTQGQAVITFSTDPDFVIVAPGQGQPVLKTDQRALVFNGKTSVVPAVVKNNTTYMPVWYVMQALQRVNVKSGWDGTHWTMDSE